MRWNAADRESLPPLREGIKEATYDFTKIVVPYNGRSYVFSRSEKSGVHGDYYIVTDDNLPGKKTYESKYWVHGSGQQTNIDWFNNPDGWLGLNSKDQYAAKGIDNNKYTSWHRNYRAFLKDAVTWDEEVVLTAASDSKAYDGTALTNANYTVKDLPEGYTITVNVSGSATNVTDEGKNTIASYKIVNDATGEDVTQLFTNVTTVDGKLTITPAAITITAADKTKVYDNDETTDPALTATVTGKPEKGVEPAYKLSRKEGQDVGGYAISVTTEKNANPNYTVTIGKNAIFSITPAAITITANAKSKTYDNDAKTDPVLDAEVTGVPAKGVAPVYTVTRAKGQDVKDNGYAITVTPTANANKNYTITTNGNTFTINPRALTLTSGSAEKEYDGIALTNADVERTNTNGLTVESGWVKEEGATYEFTGSALLAGADEANAFTINVKDGTSLANYDLTKTEGRLEIGERTEKYAIEVKSNGDRTTYDGDEHEVSGFETLEFTTEDGNTYTVEGLTAGGAKSTNATTGINNTITGEAVVKDAAGNDVTGQFDVTTTEGKLIIDRKALTLTSGSAEKEYNGNALTNADVENKNENGLTAENGWVKEEGASYEFTGSAVLAGADEANAFTITAKDGTNLNNYDLTKTEGRLVIKDRTEKYAIEVKSNGDRVTYDGDPHEVSGFETLEFTTADGNTYTVEGLTAAGARSTNATTGINNTISGEAKVLDSEGNDVTGQFDVTTTEGQLIIDRKALTLTSGSAEKE